MRSSVKTAIAALAVTLGQQASAQELDSMASLLAQDLRLAATSERLMAANYHLCRRQMPLTGILIHSRDQYRSESPAGFANGPVAVAGVVPGSPAAATLQAGDGLVVIGNTRTADLRKEGEAPVRDAAFAALADSPLTRPVAVTIARNGSQQTVDVTPVPGCRALVEIRAADTFDAKTDGRVVQISYGLTAAASEEQLAATFAHELAHVVLEHRRRLEAAGVEKGLLGEFGRNQQLNRQVEVEADRLSVHLLANAGYDPAIAPAFWRSQLGRRVGHMILRSTTYPSPEDRARLIEREIADHLIRPGAPSWPGHLLERRDRPFE
jgi:hypothetical protein